MKEKLEIKIKRCVSIYGVYNTYSLYNESGVKYASLDVETESVIKKEKYLYDYKDKKVVLITCFQTVSEFRGKGYGKYLGNYIPVGSEHQWCIDIQK